MERDGPMTRVKNDDNCNVLFVSQTPPPLPFPLLHFTFFSLLPSFFFIIPEIPSSPTFQGQILFMESPRRIEGRLILQASQLTGDGPDEFAERETCLSEDSPMTEWTDEKHSLYLDSMEASFVNQLYGSMSFLGFNLRNKKSSGTRSSSSSSRQSHGDHAHTTPSDQFKVFREGCLKKIDFERPEFRVDRVNHGLVASPWIQHFRSGSRFHHVLTSPSIHQSASMDLDGKQAILFGSASNSKHFHPCHSDHLYNHDLIGSNTEVTDQNFADDETGEKASNACSTKKKKTIETDTSSNDHTIYRTYKHPKHSLHL